MNTVATPADWTEVPVLAALRQRDDRGGSALPLLSLSAQHGIRLRVEGEGRAASEDTSQYRVVSQGDLVINRLVAKDGAIAESPMDGLVSPAYWVLRAEAALANARFLHYLLRSSPYLGEIARRSKFMPPAQYDLPWDQFRRMTLRLPTDGVQRAITDFLDAETARIDALITKRRRMTDLLEARLAMLARHLIHGDHEGTQPLRRVITSVRTGATPSTAEEGWDAGEAVDWYTPGDVGKRLLMRSAERSVTDVVVETRQVPRFPADSTLVVGIGATAGRVAHLDHDATGNQQMTCLTTGFRMAPRFLSWQLWSRTTELRQLAPYTTLPILSNDYLRSVPVAVPPIEHQRRVVAELDAATARTTHVTKALQEQVRLLGEHRQALITAAVTGEIDVTKGAA